MAAIRAATRGVASDPGLWLLGALGFSVRGGVLFILLPILWVPSPVLLSVFFGRFLTTSGLSADAVPVALSAGAVVGLAVIAGVVLASYAQLASFERLLASSAVRSLGASSVRTLPLRERAGVLARLAVLNVVGLAPILALLPTVGARIGAAGLAELQLPSSLDRPFAVSVLGRVMPELVALVAVAAVADLLVTLGVHQLLASRFGVTRPRHDTGAVIAGIWRVVRQPLRTVLLAALAWLVTVIALAIVIIATAFAWGSVREILFAPAPAGATALPQLTIQLVSIAIFGSIWVLGITLAGFASSLRGALWTTNAIH